MKHRKKLAFFCCCLIVFTFLLSSLSCYASSFVSDDVVRDTVSGVPHQFNIYFDNYEDLHGSFVSSFSPIFHENIIYGSDAGSQQIDYSYVNNGVSDISCRLGYYYRSPHEFYSLPDSFGFVEPLIRNTNTGEFEGSTYINANAAFRCSVPDYYPQEIRMSFECSDFSCWRDSDGIEGSEIVFNIWNTVDYSIYNVSIVYSVYGSSERKYISFSPGQFSNGLIYVSPSVLGYERNNVYIYVHSLDVQFHYMGETPDFFEEEFPFGYGIFYTCNPMLYYYGYGDGSNGVQGSNPAIPLIDYTTWLGTAVSGFLDLEIFPFFTFGGILMTILAFVCVVWFLKLVAGG